MLSDNPVRFQWFFLLPKYWFLSLGVFVSFIVSLCPFFFILALGKCLGQMFYWSNHRRVKIARVNLSRCYTDKTSAEVEQLLQNHCKSVGMGVLEVCIAWWWPKGRLKKKVSVEGRENLPKYGEKGTLLLVMHFTTMELAGAVMALEWVLDATYATHKNAFFEYIQNRLRSAHCKKGRMVNRKNIRGIIHSLRRGRIVWYAPDQDYGRKHSVFVDFFGIRTATVSGTARLARLGKASVVPMTLLRKPSYQGYVLRIYPPFSDLSDTDEIKNAQSLNHFMEERVRENPEQYMWVHRRFKTRPDNEPSFYD